MKQERYFPIAPYDSFAKIITSLCFLIFLASCLASLGIYTPLNEFMGFSPVLVLIIISSVFILSSLFVPQGYVVDDEKITVIRLLWNKTISLEDISKIEKYSNTGMMLRVCGIGGLFGYLGKFYIKGLGFFTGYFVNRNNACAIRTEGKKYVLSPESKDSFTDCISEKLGKENC